jgi:hypothetical protein
MNLTGGAFLFDQCFSLNPSTFTFHLPPARPSTQRPPLPWLQYPTAMASVPHCHGFSTPLPWLQYPTAMASVSKPTGVVQRPRAAALPRGNSL